MPENEGPPVGGAPEHDPQPIEELPPIEEWWGRLGPAARAEVLEHLHGPLPERARREIAEAIGRPVGDDVTLSRIDVGYVETQQQPVD